VVGGLARAAGLAVLSLLAACLPAQGWQRTDRRACDPQAPPILCLTAHVEGPYELRVGEVALLPGECLQGPANADSGRVAVTLYAAGQELGRSHVPLSQGVRTIVRLHGKRVQVVDEQGCDGRVAR
jgi:hypothetical protein